MINQGTTNRSKRGTAIFLAAVVFLHFLLTIVYVTPRHYFPGWVNRVTQAYMAPVFHQAWELFAPDPPIQEKTLKFRVQTNGNWSGWTDSGIELLRKHDSWRLSNANIIYRMHQNAAYRLWREVYRFNSQYNNSDEKQTEEWNEILSTSGYLVARYYVLRQYEKLHQNTLVDSLQLRLVIDTPPAFPGRSGDWKRDVINLPTDAVK